MNNFETPCTWSIGASYATSKMTALTSGASSNTKGDWVRVAYAMNGLMALILMFESSEIDCDFFVDVCMSANGTSPSPGTMMASNIFVSSITSAGAKATRQILVPIIGYGYMYMRCQSTGASKVISAAVMNMPGTLPRTQFISTYGDNAIATRGTPIDPGATINTSGAYTEIVSAVNFTKSAKGFFLAFGGNAVASRGEAYWMLDVAIGEAGFEVNKVWGMPISAQPTTAMITPSFTPYIPMQLAAGNRISVRAQCSSNNATDRMFDVILYAVS